MTPARRLVSRMSDRGDLPSVGVLDIETSKSVDNKRLGWGALASNFLPGYMGGKGNIAGLVDPHPSDTSRVERTALGCAIPRTDHAGNLISIVRLEDSHPPSNIVLVRQVDALVRCYNARKDKISAVVQAGTEEHSCKRSARRCRSDAGH